MELVIKWTADLANAIFGTEILPFWLKWVILGGVFIFIELLHRSWMIIWFTMGALAAAITAIFLPQAQLVQIGVFFAVTTASLSVYFIFRPPEPAPGDPHIRPGRKVICVQPIGNGQKTVGVVKIDGIEYKARLASGSSPVKKDEWVILEGWDEVDELTVSVRSKALAETMVEG